MPNFVLIPLVSSTARCFDLLRNTLWLCIGKSTPWSEEDSPPQPNNLVTEVSEPILYKRITDKYLVKEVPSNGDFYVSGYWYKVLSESEARAEKANYVLLTTTLTFEEVGDNVVFRQVGIYSYLKPKQGFENATLLTPDQVDDPGFLEWISNREPIYIQPEQMQTFYIVLAF